MYSVVTIYFSNKRIFMKIYTNDLKYIEITKLHTTRLFVFEELTYKDHIFEDVTNPTAARCKN